MRIVGQNSSLSCFLFLLFLGKMITFEPMSWFGKKDKLQLIAFQAYGTNARFYARGRALEDENIDLAKRGFFNLLINSWKRFETDEIKHTAVRISLSNGIVFEAKTDKNGYYLINESLEDIEALSNDDGWLHYTLAFDDPTLDVDLLSGNNFQGQLLIPSKSAKFGVISDIDDTILHTGVVSSLKWRVILNTFFKNVDSRIPLEGAAAFYQRLHKGVTGAAANPIFYVSHSPWNLYRYLTLFLNNHNFPKGPILLRSFSDFRTFKNRKAMPQKQKEVLNILKTYPKLPFILIGDSGEHDVDIYMEIANQFPDQIAAIYLRSVKHKRKMQRVQGLVNSYKTVPILLIEKSEDAMAHAKELGFI